MNYDIALLNHYGKETMMLMTYETLFIAKLIILLFIIFYSRTFLRRDVNVIMYFGNTPNRTRTFDLLRNDFCL